MKTFTTLFTTILLFTTISCSQDSRNIDSLLIRAKDHRDRELCFEIPSNYWDHLDGSYCIYYNNEGRDHKDKIDTFQHNQSTGRSIESAPGAMGL